MSYALVPQALKGTTATSVGQTLQKRQLVPLTWISHLCNVLAGTILTNTSFLRSVKLY